MADSNMQLQWTDDQWNRVRQVVYEEARKARVAGNFLPLYGPLEPDATYVTKEQLSYQVPPRGSGALPRISVDNSETLPLVTLEALVYLPGAQVADPELSSALIAFRRAANVLARLEDAIAFYGRPSDDDLERERAQQEAERNHLDAADKAVELATKDFENARRELREARRNSPGGVTAAELKKTNAADALRKSKEDRAQLVADQETDRNAQDRRAAASIRGLPAIYGLTGAGTASGLLDAARELRRRSRHPDVGETLVGNISSAIGQLEAAGHLGPFGCVLDQVFFEAVQTPRRDSMVLPQDRILPFLGGGALLRSSILQPNTGIVVALGGAPIDLVVGTDISVKFLQITLESRYVFRVYEKIALRVKEEEAIVLL